MSPKFFAHLNIDHYDVGTTRIIPTLNYFNIRKKNGLPPAQIPLNQQT